MSRLQQEIVKSVVDDAPPTWDRLEFEMTLVGGYASFAPYAVIGEERAIYGGTYAAGMAGLKLQKAMYEPDKGSWLSFTCTVHQSGEYSFTFNYDAPVSFGAEGQPANETWEREFTDRPRPWALIPDWNYIKQTFTEDEWQRRRHELAQQRAALRASQD